MDFNDYLKYYHRRKMPSTHIYKLMPCFSIMYVVICYTYNDIYSDKWELQIRDNNTHIGLCKAQNVN